MTHEADLFSTMLVDSCHGSNDLICLPMLWAVPHHWMVGAQFVLNFYNHWAHMMFQKLVNDPFILYIQEGFTRGDPF